MYGVEPDRTRPRVPVLLSPVPWTLTGTANNAGEESVNHARTDSVLSDSFIDAPADADAVVFQQRPASTAFGEQDAALLQASLQEGSLQEGLPENDPSNSSLVSMENDQT